MKPNRNHALIKIIWVCFIAVACSIQPPVATPNVDATVGAAIVASQTSMAATKQSIDATIEAAVSATLRASQTTTATPPIAPSITPTPTSTITPIPVIELLPCDAERKPVETCYRTPRAARSGYFYIILWLKDFDKDSIPLVKIDDVLLFCEDYPSEANSISCNKKFAFTSGEKKIELISNNGTLLGKILITTPISTPTPTRIKVSPPDPPIIPTIPPYPNP